MMANDHSNIKQAGVLSGRMSRTHNVDENFC